MLQASVLTMISYAYLKLGSKSQLIIVNYFPRASQFSEKIVSTLSYGGGVLIAAKSNLNVSEVLLPTKNDTEIIRVKVDLNSVSLYILCSYIPPNSGFELYVEHISAIKHVYSLLKARDNLIITGDCNAPSVTWSSNIHSSVLNAACSNPIPSQFFHELSNLGLFQIISVLNESLILFYR